jgi:uncharacterized protein (DUF1501 family)
MAKPTRRDFIKTGAGAIGAGLALPVLNKTAAGTTIVKTLLDDATGNGNILVIVELAGGNDGLNTVIPLAQYDAYASVRPTIKLDKAQVLPLAGSTTMGLTPNLSGIKPLDDMGKLAIIQAVGYPNPNLSHFTSRDIWYSANTSANISTAQRTGWIGRQSALYGNKANPLDTVAIGVVNTSLYAPGATVAGISSANAYQYMTDARFTGDRNNQVAVARMVDANTSPDSQYIDLFETSEVNALDSAGSVSAANSGYSSTVTYPANNGFASGLQLIAKLATASANLGTRVFYISTGGFDTHANQANDQPRLHQQVAAGLKAFYDDLVAHGIADRVLIMAWSEFGRRVAENNSGTDHGTANNVYIIGGRVKGGVYGVDPSLTDLSGGNLKFKIDFRQVYATIIQQWLGGDSVQVLGGNFTTLGFI